MACSTRQVDDWIKTLLHWCIVQHNVPTNKGTSCTSLKEPPVIFSLTSKNHLSFFHSNTHFAALLSAIRTALLHILPYVQYYVYSVIICLQVLHGKAALLPSITLQKQLATQAQSALLSAEHDSISLPLDSLFALDSLSDLDIHALVG